MKRFFLLLAGVALLAKPSLASYTAPPHASIDIQYTGELDYNAPVKILNLDGFDTSAKTVAALRERGVYPMCYINVGATEDWRPDIKSFPSEVIGNAYDGWDGEHWLDIRNIRALAPIMEARIKMCKEKGFLGIDPDNLDSYQTNTGFTITKEDQLTYLKWLAALAHKHGMAIGLKNAPNLAPELEPHFDWTLTESCFDQGWCEKTQVFRRAGKPVYIIEYTDNNTDHTQLCAYAKKHDLIALLKHRNLGGEFRKTCD